MPPPAEVETPLRPVGLVLAAATAAVHLTLAAVSLRRSCRRYGDLLHGLCLHAALVGCLQGGVVTSLHTLLLTAGNHDKPVWRVCCKLYLFCRVFLPGLFLYLTCAITVCFRSVRYPPRRCGRSCTRLGYLTAHFLPWAACAAGLLPVLAMHKEATEAALSAQARCLLVERWSWLGPLSVLLGAPLLVQLLLTCLLCAYKPYRAGHDTSADAELYSDAGNAEVDDDEENDDEFDYLDDTNEDRDDREFAEFESAVNKASGGKTEPEVDQHQRRGLVGRRSRHRWPQRCQRQPEHGNGCRAGAPPPVTVDSVGVGSSGRRYFADSRLLRGRPMRLSRSLLLCLSLLQAGTQLPHCIACVLQTVLRNLHSRQLIQQTSIDALYWLHLVYFPVAGLLLNAFVAQLHRAFRITESEIQQELRTGCRAGRGAKEVLQTTSMLTSL